MDAKDYSRTSILTTIHFNMDIRKFMSQKRPHDATVDKRTGTGNSSEDPAQQSSEVSSLPSSSGEPPPPHSKKQQLSSSEKRRQTKLSFLTRESGKKSMPG